MQISPVVGLGPGKLFGHKHIRSFLNLGTSNFGGMDICLSLPWMSFFLLWSIYHHVQPQDKPGDGGTMIPT